MLHVHAGRVVQHFTQLHQAEIVHLLARDDADRVRRLARRQHQAVRRADGARRIGTRVFRHLAQVIGGDDHFRHRCLGMGCGLWRRRLHGIDAAIGLEQDQLRALQGAAQGLLRREIAVHGRPAGAAHQIRIDGNAHAATAGNRDQAGVQGLGRHVIAHGGWRYLRRWRLRQDGGRGAGK
ncbi:hypothetical protein D3C81_948460 [compost metagenome]